MLLKAILAFSPIIPQLADAGHERHGVPEARQRALPQDELMYAAPIRASESWRGAKVTEFEPRQLQALRHDLLRAHAERVSPVVRAST